ncbi:MAG: 50S ribosomal protein L25 [Gemmatimonadales bacterium]|nr:50S ribosomal protein L25 [Gemmatimonadales bacterium]
MSKTAVLSASVRNQNGKGAARALRRDGKVPAVVYGRGRAPESLTLDAVALERLLAKTRATTLLDVSVDDRQPVKALIREVQRNPLRPIDILHVDLYEVHADEEIAVDVPIKFVGTADGVKNAGGVFEAVLHQLQIRVLPGDIPDHIEVDVSPLGLGQSIHVSDLTLAKGEFLTDGGVTLCTVVAPKTEATTEGAEGGAEPELIRKPKPAEDEANAKG